MANVTQNQELIEAKTRDTNAAADLKLMKLAIMRKEYVSLSEVNTRWAEQAGRVKAKLLGLPSRLTPQLAMMTSKSEVNALLTEAINEALSEIAGDYEL